MRSRNGFIVTAELGILSTLVVGVLVISIGAIASKIVGETNDFAAAVGHLDQSYGVGGLQVAHAGQAVGGGAQRLFEGAAQQVLATPRPDLAQAAGSAFADGADFGDGTQISITGSGGGGEQQGPPPDEEDSDSEGDADSDDSDSDGDSDGDSDADSESDSDSEGDGDSDSENDEDSEEDDDSESGGEGDSDSAGDSNSDSR